MKLIREVWFDCFIFLFLLKTKNDDKNVFVEFLKIFLVKMKIRNNQKMKIIKSHFSIFSIKNINLILDKIKMR